MVTTLAVVALLAVGGAFQLINALVPTTNTNEQADIFARCSLVGAQCRAKNSICTLLPQHERFKRQLGGGMSGLAGMGGMNRRPMSPFGPMGMSAMGSQGGMSGMPSSSPMMRQGGMSPMMGGGGGMSPMMGGGGMSPMGGGGGMSPMMGGGGGGMGGPMMGGGGMSPMSRGMSPMMGNGGMGGGMSPMMGGGMGGMRGGGGGIPSRSDNGFNRPPLGLYDNGHIQHDGVGSGGGFPGARRQPFGMNRHRGGGGRFRQRPPVRPHGIDRRQQNNFGADDNNDNNGGDAVYGVSNNSTHDTSGMNDYLNGNNTYNGTDNGGGDYNNNNSGYGSGSGAYEKNEVYYGDTKELPGTTTSNSEYKYYDTDKKTYADQYSKSRRDEHYYTHQTNTYNKNIYNVHRNHILDYVNHHHQKDIYKHTHPEVKKDYVTYIYDTYQPIRKTKYTSSKDSKVYYVDEPTKYYSAQRTVYTKPVYEPEKYESGYGDNSYGGGDNSYGNNQYDSSTTSGTTTTTAAPTTTTTTTTTTTARPSTTTTTTTTESPYQVYGGGHGGGSSSGSRRRNRGNVDEREDEDYAAEGSGDASESIIGTRSSFSSKAKKQKTHGKKHALVGLESSAPEESYAEIATALEPDTTLSSRYGRMRPRGRARRGVEEQDFEAMCVCAQSFVLNAETLACECAEGQVVHASGFCA